jgi:predicted nucleic acid-binding protein
MKILIDTNILLDVVFDRQSDEHSEEIIDKCESGELKGFIAWHTINDFYYMVEKQARKQGRDGDTEAREHLKHLLGFLDVGPADTDMATDAVESQIRDFEYSLQSIVALRTGCRYIVTRNIKDYKKSNVKAVLPGDKQLVRGAQ